MRLTRKQLQADLDAASKREDLLSGQYERAERELRELRAANKFLQEERDDWRFAFRTICKVVAR